MPAPTFAGVLAALGHLAREGAAPVAKIANDPGISESCLRNWTA